MCENIIKEDGRRNENYWCLRMGKKWKERNQINRKVILKVIIWERYKKKQEKRMDRRGVGGRGEDKEVC
jgi:hypothetical protein